MRTFALLLLSSSSLPAVAGAQPLGIYIPVVPSELNIWPPLDQPMTHSDAEWTIFVNKDGGDFEYGFDDARSNHSSVGGGHINPWPYGDASWTTFLDCMKEMYAPFNVYVTDEEPTDDRPYIENVVGGNPTDVGMWPGVGGVSPAGCSPINYAITYSFAEVYGDNPMEICNTSAQETAHAFGLDHQLNCLDPMTYLPACGEKAFQDSDDDCGEFGPRPCMCGGNTQNSYRQLLALLGPHSLPDPPRDIGLPCLNDGECVSNYCIDIGGEMTCSEECDFTTPGLGCPAGYACFDQSCGEGACVLAALGDNPNGAACTENSECASGLCAGATCATPCDPSHDRCPGTGDCVGEGDCGHCEGGPENQGYGTECTDGGVCASGVCGGFGDDHYCTKRCTLVGDEPELCPDGYSCESGYCYLQGDGTLGTPCDDAEECISGVCSTEGFCTSPCGEVGLGCPEGFTCEDTRDICVPEIGNLPFGQHCEQDTDCLSLHCRDGICSRECGPEAPCVGNYECLEEDGASLCEPKGPGLFSPGGCGCTVPGAASAWGLAALALPTLLALRRRRR